MNVPVRHRDNCRLCDSPHVERVVELAPVPLAEKYVTAEQLNEPTDFLPVDLYMCLNCGHVQLLDVVDPTVVWSNFTYRSAQTPGIVTHLHAVANELLDKYRPAAGSLVVDVGSNDGTLLQPFKARGMRVLGVDPAREIAAEAIAAGIPTLPEILTPELALRIRAEHGAASIITVFNAFAHADDMASMAESIRSLLAPDGILVFEVQYLLDIIDKSLLGTIFHEHLCHHSVKPMMAFLARFGMQLIDVERVSIQNGSLIGTAQLASGGRLVAPSVGEMLALEEQRQLDKPQTVRQFGDHLKALKAQAAQLMAEWKRQGKTVAAYGAARSGPTFICQLGLQDAIEYVMDDHPQKVGRYTPGHHIQVLPTSTLDERMPDYVIILAWIHAKKIIANNQAFLDRGGHFVVCTPQLEVVGKESLTEAR